MMKLSYWMAIAMTVTFIAWGIYYIVRRRWPELLCTSVMSVISIAAAWLFKAFWI